MRFIYIALLVVMIVAMGGFFYSPYSTLNEVDRAIAENDQQVLAQQVNFVNLRELATLFIDSKLELKSRIEGRTDMAMALQDYAFAKRFVGNVVDSLMTPKGFSYLVKGDLDYVDHRIPTASKPSLFAGADVVFDSLTQAHTFVDQQRNGLKTKVILRRVGLFSWRIDNLNYPVDAMFERFVKELQA